MYSYFAIVILTIQIKVISGDTPRCDYFDTVDLTKSPKFENGSYLYEGILIPKEDVRNYSKQYFFDGEEDVPEHPRGCVCQNKTCIRLCCELGQVLVDNERKCVKASNEYKTETLVRIKLDNGKEIKRNIYEFTLLTDLPIPCKNHLHMNPEANAFHNWSLFENGTLFRHGDSASLSRRDYCIQPHQVRNAGGIDIYKILPHQCIPENESYLSYVQGVSIVFMVMIIVVYLILPNFRTVHGRCCVCYFTCISLSFFLLNLTNSGWVTAAETWNCYLIGYLGYYTVMAAFSWLLVISYNLWRTFDHIGIGQKSKFCKYNIFVWSMSAILLAISIVIDNLDFIPWRPDFALYDCWINTYSWTASVYYYGPMFILLIINITLFIKTTIRIIVQNRENRFNLAQTVTQSHLRNLANFGMFFRLFVIVGVIWILEIISHVAMLCQFEDVWTNIIDYIVSGQGIVVFVVTILRKEVLNNLYELLGRTKSKREPSSTSSQISPSEMRLMPKNDISLKDGR